MVDPMTGEIILEDDIDLLLSYIQESEKTISMIRAAVSQAKHAICKKADFGDARTVRVQGDKYRCKIEMPSKIMWDQKKLESLYWNEHDIDEEGITIKIATYKVDMRRYKEIINTVGNDDFNNYKNELISANLGVTGSPRFTIE